MEKDLFAIFPDLPWTRPAGAWVRPLVPSVQRPHPPVTGVARRRIPVYRNIRPLWMARTDDAPLRRIRQLAQTQYERLPPREKTSGIGRVLQNIVEIANSTLFVSR
jgi:hypothetical protein